MTVDEYNARLAAQGGVCAICGKTQSTQLAVDHDHKTGTVRGLLCKHCNVGLGYFNDDPSTLTKAATYLLEG